MTDICLPDCKEWNGLSLEKQTVFGRLVESQLPPGFSFVGIRNFSLGAVKQNVAVYSFEGRDFSLILGGEVSLGFDSSRWQPNCDEEESWADTAEEYGILESLVDHVGNATTTCRTVSISPILIESIAQEIGWEAVELEDADVKELIRLSEGDENCTCSMNRDGREIRVTRQPDGAIKAEAACRPTHQSLSSILRDQGFRFPTSDEWEFACGGGSKTLFRWGDHVPCDRYPTDICPAEANWRKNWVLSGGELEYPEEGFESDWCYHLRPNAFGLLIAQNPYKSELVAENDMTRGGDGGCTICGGAGFFLGWLPLASAYFEEHSCVIDPEYGISVGYTVGRRVLALSDK